MMEHHMHDHQLDLIMDLAAGTLEGRRRDDAAASVAACDECQAELDAQLLALETLAAAAPARLTDLEAARMRRALRDELDLVTPEPVAAVTSPRSRSISWQRLSVGLSMAAVLLLFVAVVPALDLFGGAGGSDAESVALSPTAETPGEVITEAAGRAGDTTSEAELGFAGGEEPTTTALAAPADGHLLIDFGSDPDLLAVRRASERGLSETGDAANLIGLTADLDSVAVSERSDDCIDEALDDFAAGRTAVTLGAGIVLDDDVFVVAYVNEADGTVEVVAHDAATCAVVTSTG